jgi:hypothetical protein
MIIAVVVHPDHPEGEHPLRFHHPIEQIDLFVLRMLVNHRGDGGQYLLHGLNKFRLAAVLPLHIFDHAGDIGVHVCIPPQISRAGGGPLRLFSI